MAKAVLVMDMPGQVCQKCTLCYGTKNDDEYLCCATGKLVADGKNRTGVLFGNYQRKSQSLNMGTKVLKKASYEKAGMLV